MYLRAIKGGRQRDKTISEMVKAYAYNVEDYGWLSKAETIALTEQGRIDAVVMTENGRTYVRTRPDEATSNNLDEMKPK